MKLNNYIKNTDYAYERLIYDDYEISYTFPKGYKITSSPFPFSSYGNVIIPDRKGDSPNNAKLPTHTYRISTEPDEAICGNTAVFSLQQGVTISCFTSDLYTEIVGTQSIFTTLYCEARSSVGDYVLPQAVTITCHIQYTSTPFEVSQ